MLDILTFTPDESQKAYFENYNYRIDQYVLRGDIVAAKARTCNYQGRSPDTAAYLFRICVS
ncbi:hypothetical protein ACLBQR_31930, partial [Klebsiella pneumoniae]